MSWHAGWLGPGWTRLHFVVQSVCERHTYTVPPVELAQQADDTALVATSRSSSLLVRYLEAYLGRLELWLRDWRITINVIKSTAMLFVKATRRNQKPRPMQFLGEPIEWVETDRYLGVTLIHSLPSRHTSTRCEIRQLKDWACMAPSSTEEADCPSETVCYSTSSSSVL
jgi:hypothetical protein